MLKENTKKNNLSAQQNVSINSMINSYGKNEINARQH